MIIGLFITGILAFESLPEKIAVHWNIKGNPDSYMDRTLGVFLFPGITALVFVLMVISPVIDPGKENYTKFLKDYRVIRYGIVIFLAGIYLITLLYNLGYQVDIGKLVTLGLGILFIIIGNFMPRVRHNYFVGIKVPWTLASDKIWKKTHRIGGRLYVISGVLILFSIFLPPHPRFWILLGLLLGSTIITIVYSYYLYNKHNN